MLFLCNFVSIQMCELKNKLLKTYIGRFASPSKSLLRRLVARFSAKYAPSLIRSEAIILPQNWSQDGNSMTVLLLMISVYSA